MQQTITSELPDLITPMLATDTMLKTCVALFCKDRVWPHVKCNNQVMHQWSLTKLAKYCSSASFTQAAPYIYTGSLLTVYLCPTKQKYMLMFIQAPLSQEAWVMKYLVQSDPTKPSTVTFGCARFICLHVFSNIWRMISECSQRSGWILLQHYAYTVLL